MSATELVPVDGREIEKGTKGTLIFLVFGIILTPFILLSFFLSFEKALIFLAIYSVLFLLVEFKFEVVMHSEFTYHWLGEDMYTYKADNEEKYNRTIALHTICTIAFVILMGTIVIMYEG